MRIHSHFKDYYDSALSFGIDPALHYNRDDGRRFYYTQDIKAKLPQDLTNEIAHHDTDLVRAGRHWIPKGFHSYFLIGFCGRIYPCIKISKDGRVRFLYSEDALKAYEAERGSPFRKDTHKRMVNFLASSITRDDIFIEVNAPVFILYDDSEVRGHELYLDTNPFLKEIEFFRAVDAFAAFQEISMYLGNQLVKRDRPDEIADKYKISQHGFDNWSFRKQASK
jgi:hypothetical protein